MSTSAAVSTALDDSLFFKKSAFFKLYLFSVVILVHAVNYEAYGLENAPGIAAAILYRLELLIVYLCALSLPMYFSLSGYGFMLGYTPDKTIEKWKRRFFSLFIPWLLWNTIMWLFGIAIESIPQIAQHVNTDFGYELSLRSWLVDGLLHYADGPMWFISNLMVAVMAAPAIYFLMKNRYVGLLALGLGFLAVHLSNASRYSVLIALVFFAEGCYCALHLRHLIVRQYKMPARVIALLVLVLYLIFCTGSRVQDGGILNVLTFSLTSAALWVAAGDVELGRKGKKAEEYRFWLYASHYFPIECVEKLWLIFGGVSVASAWAGMILCPVVTALLLLCAAYPIKKYCYPVWCVLTGGKPKKRRA